MYSDAVEGHKNMSYKSKLRRTIPPLSLYTKKSESTKNSIPLSHYTTTLIYHPATHPMEESTMDIFVPENKEKVNRKNHPLWFWMDPTVSHRGLRINYIPISMPSTAVSNSSQSNVSFDSLSSKSKVSSGSYIPEDVALSILKKLSIKSLKRFGCVCKSWFILFESTDFMTTYSKHFISRHGSDDDYHTFILQYNFLYNYQLYYPEFYLIEKSLKVKLNLPSPVAKFGYRTCILNSTTVNGIFCFCLHKYCSIYEFVDEVQYVLWNPLTDEFRVIPSAPTQLTQKFHSTNLDYYKDHTFHGFGYDQLRDDFKVIQYESFDSKERDIYSQRQPSKRFFETYSLKGKSWTMVDMDKDLDHWGYFRTYPFDGLEVYLDGVCHWLASKAINDKYAVTMLSFDLGDEVFLATPIGEEPCSPHTWNLRLTVLNGSIALISSYQHDIILHIFILGELGVSESWIKLYIYGPLPSIQWPPIGFGKMGYIFVTKTNDEVAYVDLSTQIIEEVGITGAYHTYFIGGLYKESLVSI